MSDNNKSEIKIYPIPLLAVQTHKYVRDFNKEYNYIKTLKYNKPLFPKRITTSVDEYIIHKKPLHNLYEFFNNALNNYTKTILNSKKQIKISNSWIAKQEKGESTEPHSHTSIVNGSFYFNVPDDKTPLVFDTYNSLNERYDTPIKIQTGLLVLFPNELSHWVPESVNEETRYCLAFNTISQENFNNSMSLSENYNNK